MVLCAFVQRSGLADEVVRFVFVMRARFVADSILSLPSRPFFRVLLAHLRELDRKSSGSLNEEVV